MPETKVSSKELRDFLGRIFRETGMPQADAEFAAWCTVQTDLWGVDSHGTLRFPDYEARLRKRVVNPAPRIVNKLADDLPVAHLDADAALGYIASRDGMRLAIEKAKRFGVSVVVVSNSNHNGAAALYSRMAAAEGLLGLSTTNVRPNIGIKGAAAPVTGNNPIALAAPLPGGEPFCIDVAMSQVAQGKLILAAKKGEKIPAGWATDRNGVETDDPQAGLKGILLPTGGHKGFGISLFIDIVTGLLGGGTFLGQICSMYSHPEAPSNLAHLFAVLDPARFMEPAEFARRLGEWRAMFQASPVLPGLPRLILPGEPETDMEKKRLAAGIPLPEKLWADLEAIAKHHGVPLPATL